jgi:hypothetical protein
LVPLTVGGLQKIHFEKFTMRLRSRCAVILCALCPVLGFQFNLAISAHSRGNRVARCSSIERCRPSSLPETTLFGVIKRRADIQEAEEGVVYTWDLEVCRGVCHPSQFTLSQRRCSRNNRYTFCVAVLVARRARV